MFEYQSMIAEITGMDVANCSLYDGATALAEAMMMCSRLRPKKQTFLIPSHISWEKKSVIHNYGKGAGIIIKEIPYDVETGMISIEDTKKMMTSDVFGIYVENPNFFGIFEESVKDIKDLIDEVDGLFVAGIDPLSLGIIKEPGAYGSDIVIGEGRALGNPMDFGGSSLGIFACKQAFIRQMPGRIIGKTKDKEGKQAFCMTLQTREQHIRRQKATSNICTNEGLCALAATVYLSLLGGKGLQELSAKNFEQGQLLAKTLTSMDIFEQAFTGTHFNECTMRSTVNTTIINSALLKQNIHGGLQLDPWFKKMNNTLLFGVTEMHTEEDIKQLKQILMEVDYV
jgi:glycine dehydrogenase subunit 1